MMGFYDPRSVVEMVRFHNKIERRKSERQLDAARRAICLVNRLRPGPTKERHASRVWKKYNELRRAAA